MFQKKISILFETPPCPQSPHAFDYYEWRPEVIVGARVVLNVLLLVVVMEEVRRDVAL